MGRQKGLLVGEGQGAQSPRPQTTDHRRRTYHVVGLAFVRHVDDDHGLPVHLHTRLQPASATPTPGARARQPRGQVTASSGSRLASRPFTHLLVHKHARKLAPTFAARDVGEELGAVDFVLHHLNDALYMACTITIRPPHSHPGTTRHAGREPQTRAWRASLMRS